MTIDDIHYLYKNSTKENIVLLIDSSKRDKTAYRTPSEFVVEFPEPFRNVIGCEVLNAAIPRTTFTVDNHNNVLHLWSYEYGLNDDNEQEITSAFRDKTLIPNDFNSAEKLLSALTTLFRETDETFNVEPDSLALEADADIATKGFLKLESTLSPFIMDNRLLKSPMNPILGFSLHASESDGTYETLSHLKKSRQLIFPLSLGEDIIDRTKLASHVHELDVDTSVLTGTSTDSSTSTSTDSSGMTTSELELELPLHFNCPLLIETVKVNDESYDIDGLESPFVYGGKFNLPVSFSATEPTLHVEVKYTFLIPNGLDIQALDPERTYASRISNYNFDDEDPVRVIEDSSGDDEEDTVVNFFTDGTRLSVFLNQFKIKVQEIQNAKLGKQLLLFRSTHGTRKQSFLLEVDYAVDADGDFVVQYDASQFLMRNLNPLNFVRIFNVDYQVFIMKNDKVSDAQRIKLIEACPNDVNSDSTINSVLYDMQFKIVPPGIINMVTENYVILRCPEIENHSRGSYDANDVSPGLALFTIDVKSGYAANKNEFFSVKYKEFHPIGKLSRLHFRFERKSDQRLYDFKGIDLHFILSLKMLAAQKLNERELEYSLNPNYDPDYQGFMKSSFDYVESDEELDGKKIKQSDFEEEIKLQNIAYERKLQLEESSEESEYEFTTDEEEEED